MVLEFFALALFLFITLDSDVASSSIASVSASAPSSKASRKVVLQTRTVVLGKLKGNGRRSGERRMQGRGSLTSLVERYRP
ncbi:hypothetical protein PHAVU_007G279950 [Phaseolus vulgaris]